MRERMDALTASASPHTFMSILEEATALMALADEKGDAEASAFVAKTRSDRLQLCLSALHVLRIMQITNAAASEVTAHIAKAAASATAEGATEADIAAATTTRDELADVCSEWLRDALAHCFYVSDCMARGQLGAFTVLSLNLAFHTFNISSHLLRLTKSAEAETARSYGTMIAAALRTRLTTKDMLVSTDGMESIGMVTEILSLATLITPEQAQDVLMAVLTLRTTVDDAVTSLRPKSIPASSLTALAHVTATLLAAFPAINGPVTDDALALCVSLMTIARAQVGYKNERDLPILLADSAATCIYLTHAAKVHDVLGALISGVLVDVGGPEALSTRRDEPDVQEALGRFGPKLKPVMDVFEATANPAHALLKWYVDNFKTGAAARAELSDEVKAQLTNPQIGMAIALAAGVLDKSLQVIMTCAGIFSAEHTSAAGIGEDAPAIASSMMLAPRLAQVVTMYGQRLRQKNLGPWEEGSPANSKEPRLLSMQILFRALVETENPLAQMFVMTEQDMMQLQMMAAAQQQQAQQGSGQRGGRGGRGGR